MKKPKVILHNSISLDGSLLGFDVDMEKHYQIAGGYQADIHLIGSNTVEAGIKMFCPQIPEEEKSDFIKPERSKDLPLWVIPDTRGKLQGLHHVYRRFEMCRDIVILVSRKTPQKYLSYLKERNYDYHMAGEDHIDCRKALDLLAKQYHSKTILTDTGRILNCILINEGLVDEISLLVHPVIVGTNPYALFSGVKGDIKLELASAKEMGDGKVWLTYKVQQA
ncbi:MAG: dihydrofolate reductase family protein [Kiritimatiellia bacterium]